MHTRERSPRQRRRDDGKMVHLHVRCNDAWRDIGKVMDITEETTLRNIGKVINRMCDCRYGDNTKILRKIPEKQVEEPPFMKCLMGVMGGPRYVELCTDNDLTLGQLRDPPFNNRGETWIVLFQAPDGSRRAMSDDKRKPP